VQRRIAEAERMGFRRAIVPVGSGVLPSGQLSAGEAKSQLEVHEAASISAAIATALGG
jgi:predicted ATP-dependent serine protease